MNNKEFEGLAKQLLPDLPGYFVKGSLAASHPVKHVLRGLYFHAAHYLPVGLSALLTLIASQFALNHYPAKFTYDRYAYILCAEVILAAGYLFKTYWIGMRNMMYANR